MKLYRRNAFTGDAYRLDYQRWYMNLSPAQQAAVYHYSDTGYRWLNHNLRHGKPLTGAQQGLCNDLDAALDSPPVGGEINLYRGVANLAVLPSPGDTWQVAYHLSCTSDPHQLFKYLDKDNPVIYELITNLGRPVSDMHEEYEYLLPRSTVFAVENVLVNVDWHAEYPDTDHSRALASATVIQLRPVEDPHDPRAETRTYYP